jgi:hypothetical protein
MDRRNALEQLKAMQRPGPVTSDAPDDAPKRAQYEFYFASGGSNSLGFVTVSGWIEQDTELDEQGFLYAYRHKSSTEDDPPVIINTNLLLFAKPC